MENPIEDLNGIAPLAELIDKDPLELTRSDIDVLVAEFRRKREEWAKEEAAARASGKRPRTSKGTQRVLTEKDKQELTLENLFGDPNASK